MTTYGISYYIKNGIEQYDDDLEKYIKNNRENVDIYRNLLSSVLSISHDAFFYLLNSKKLINSLTNKQVEKAVNHAEKDCNWARDFNDSFSKSFLYDRYKQIKSDNR